MEGETCCGQDAQSAGVKGSYTISAGGLTVLGNVTGPIGQQNADTNGNDDIDASDKLIWTAAQACPAALNAESYGGYDDWRWSTFKESYSLIDFQGTDPPPEGTSTSDLVPFIDDGYFGFACGDTTAGERILDAQYAARHSLVPARACSRATSVAMSV